MVNLVCGFVNTTRLLGLKFNLLTQVPLPFMVIALELIIMETSDLIDASCPYLFSFFKP